MSPKNGTAFNSRGEPNDGPEVPPLRAAQGAAHRKRPAETTHLKWREWKDAGLSFTAIAKKHLDCTGETVTRDAVMKALRRLRARSHVAESRDPSPEPAPTSRLAVALALAEIAQVELDVVAAELRPYNIQPGERRQDVPDDSLARWLDSYTPAAIEDLLTGLGVVPRHAGWPIVRPPRSGARGKPSSRAARAFAPGVLAGR